MTNLAHRFQFEFPAEGYFFEQAGDEGFKRSFGTTKSLGSLWVKETAEYPVIKLIILF